MNINSIPEAFESRIRIAIISALLQCKKDFNELKDITMATDGNLSSHLNKLEDMGYIYANKEFVGKRPKTTYVLTNVGRDMFKEYVILLEKMISKVED